MNINIEVWPLVAIVWVIVAGMYHSAPYKMQAWEVPIARTANILIALAFTVVMFFFTTPPDPATVIQVLP